MAIKPRGLSDSQSYVTTFMKPLFSLLHKLVFPNSFFRTFKLGYYIESIWKLFGNYSVTIRKFIILINLHSAWLQKFHEAAFFFCVLKLH